MIPINSWFAVHVLANHEFSVALMLCHKGYDNFVPTYSVRRLWSDRTKRLERPLFPGYVFCRTEYGKIGLIVTTPGVRQIVSCGGKPCIVPEAEINVLKQVIASKTNISPYPYLKLGQRVEIKEGPLAGITGIVMQIKNRRHLIVSVDVVMKSVMIDMDLINVASIASISDHSDMQCARAA